MRPFVDANVAILATGRPSDRRESCVEILALSKLAGKQGLASAEVLQDILHPLVRRELLPRAVACVAIMLESVTVVSLLPEDVRDAAAADLPSRLDARDRVHVAVMNRLGIDTIISTDRAFDEVPGIRRLDPLAFPTWRAEVFEA